MLFPGAAELKKNKIKLRDYKLQTTDFFFFWLHCYLRNILNSWPAKVYKYLPNHVIFQIMWSINLGFLSSPVCSWTNWSFFQVEIIFCYPYSYNLTSLLLSTPGVMKGFLQKRVRIGWTCSLLQPNTLSLGIPTVFRLGAGYGFYDFNNSQYFPLISFSRHPCIDVKPYFHSSLEQEQPHSLMCFKFITSYWWMCLH